MFTSTHALSVYNALSLSGRDMTLEEAREYARAHGYEQLDHKGALDGLGFLVARGFVRVDGSTIRVTRRKPGPTRAAWPLIRTNADTDLAYA